ncbi:MAG: ABC transporter ATP-binding protein [Burkholderiales bacterium]|jgi:branched-chain amino acid transport system ATP-binding protein|nr:ABC transporter ATP-binding protein [Burkholderiales bacterium]
MNTPLLDVRALNKRFGGVVATDGVDLQVRSREIHALIGPNGAGKTSLVAQLAGQLASDSGQVHFDGADITRLVAHQRARRGLVRSFQITRLLKSLSVLDNLAFAVQATQARVFAAWRPVRDEQTLFERARELLARLGLAHKADSRIDQLSHGEQRALEVGMTLASRPRLVLLDEPLAGMGAQESQSMTRLIESLRQDCAVLLIEHDVNAVFRLADRVSVLVSGRIIASGTPDAVRNHAGAIAAYLGDAQDAI